MSNVVSLRRSKDDLKDRVLDEIKNNSNHFQFYITFPEEDEGKIFFYTNFDPGANEIYAIEALLDYLRSQVYTVVEDT